MSEIPAAELSPGVSSDRFGGDVNATTKRRQIIVWVVLLGLIGGPVTWFAAHSIFSAPRSPNAEVARRSQATADAAKPPVADTTAEALSGEVRDAKALTDQAQSDNVALKGQVDALRLQLATDHADAQRTIAALSHEIQTRTPSNGAGPVAGAGASGAASDLAQGAEAAPHSSRALRNPFAPSASVLDRAVGDGAAASGADASSDAPGSGVAALAHRTMTVIKATTPGGMAPGGEGRPSADAAHPLASTVGPSGLGGVANAPPKGSFTGQLEVFESSKFVPPNAYAQAQVLVGVDAATGTTFSTDPKPVMFRITGPAVHVGANGKFQTTDVTGCMVNGAAFGELPSEKVYIKLQKITCPVGVDHFSVATIEGYVSSKGKAGVRGTVISREGSLTGRALIAGTLNGLGQALSTNVQRSVSGVNTAGGSSSLLSTRELSPGQIATGAVGTGVSGAASMLADYYIKRAEQYQPVIEMPTGISVELVFLSGFQVK